MATPKRVKLVEVGARDGLQNEPGLIATADKVELINRLSASGLSSIEVGSFVSPDAMPQMADTGRVIAGIDRRPAVSYPVLVPNLRGLEAALAAGAEEIAFFAAASETFSQRNINCSINQSLDRLADILAVALERGVRVRGYVSCVAGCPYEGDVSINAVVAVAERLVDLGCYEISLGDTIGVATPMQAKAIVAAVAESVPREAIAVHFHDTFGQALANILAVLELDVGVIDSSVAGLGGCPYAPGATGNVASEDVLYMLHGLGIETGVDLNRMLDAGSFVSKLLNKPSGSKVARAYAAATYNGSGKRNAGCLDGGK